MVWFDRIGNSFCLSKDMISKTVMGPCICESHHIRPTLRINEWQNIRSISSTFKCNHSAAWATHLAYCTSFHQCDAVQIGASWKIKLPVMKFSVDCITLKCSLLCVIQFLRGFNMQVELGRDPGSCRWRWNHTNTSWHILANLSSRM